MNSKHRQGWVEAIAGHATECRQPRLPYPIVSDHGKDLRDYINEGNPYAALNTLAAAAEPFTAPTGTASSLLLENGIRNFSEEDTGEEKPEIVPLSMTAIKSDVERQIPGWPSRFGSTLFIDDEKHGLSFLRTQAALFGWLAGVIGNVDWRKGPKFVGKDEFFAELQRTARVFRAIEAYPHFPPFAGHYYSHPPIEPGDGKTLSALVDFFNPATDLDRDLIVSLFVTGGWGGRPGARPVFAITAPKGRGAGKTSLAKAIGCLYGGCFDISMEEEFGRIKNRLLTPEAAVKRCMLLDNVKKNRLSWAEAESLVTSSEISGHQLYKGEATRPNTLLWMITLNGPSLSRDFAQRCVVIQLKHPKQSATWEDEVSIFIEDHRWGILGDMAAFFQRVPVTLAKYSRWGAWERAVLARMPEPEELQRVIAERQAILDADDSEAADIEDHFRRELEKLGYDPTTDSVHVPNEVARTWYGRATGAQATTTAATRTIGQASDEGLLKRLRINPCRSHGRGLLWLAEGGGPVHYDLGDRLRDHQWQDNRHWDR